jgi:hypothetical protein
VEEEPGDFRAHAPIHPIGCSGNRFSYHSLLWHDECGGFTLALHPPTRERTCPFNTLFGGHWIASSLVYLRLHCQVVVSISTAISLWRRQWDMRLAYLHNLGSCLALSHYQLLPCIVSCGVSVRMRWSSFYLIPIAIAGCSVCPLLISSLTRPLHNKDASRRLAIAIASGCCTWGLSTAVVLGLALDAAICRYVGQYYDTLMVATTTFWGCDFCFIWEL